MNGLRGATTDESFITPSLAKKIIDFVHLLKYRRAVIDEVIEKRNSSFLFINIHLIGSRKQDPYVVQGFNQ
jgi:hypothetical protein